MVKLLQLPDFIERRREYTLETDFFEESPRQMFDAYTIAELAANANLASVVFQTAGQSIYIHDVGILPTTVADVAPNNGNTCAVTITTDGTIGVVTKTYQTDVVWPAVDTYDSLFTSGTAGRRHLAQGGHLEVGVVQGTASNISVTDLVVTYSDANAYPVPGFQVLVTDGGSIAITTDGVKRICRITTGATDNDEAYLFSSGESFKFLANKPFVAECKLAITEADDDRAMVIFGLMSDVGAGDAMQDDEDGPKGTYSGAIIFKMGTDVGTRVWNVESSVGSTQVPATGNGTASTVVASTGGVFQTLRIEFLPTTTTGNQVNFFVDGVQIGSNIQTLTSATEMHLVVGVKASSAAAEIVDCDYIGCSQMR